MKSHMYSLVILAFLAGCIPSGTGRRVDSNAFSSSYPKMVVKISSDFHYIGKRERQFDAKVLGGGGGSGNFSFESHTWRSPKLVLIIGFKELQDQNTDWLPLINIWKKYPTKFRVFLRSWNLRERIV